MVVETGRGELVFLLQLLRLSAAVEPLQLAALPDRGASGLDAGVKDFERHRRLVLGASAVLTRQQQVAQWAVVGQIRQEKGVEESLGHPG
ncbi:hypothetical protein N2W54_001218 [Lotmaria passim]